MLLFAFLIESSNCQLLTVIRVRVKRQRGKFIQTRRLFKKGEGIIRETRLMALATSVYNINFKWKLLKGSENRNKTLMRGHLPHMSTWSRATWNTSILRFKLQRMSVETASSSGVDLKHLDTKMIFADNKAPSLFLCLGFCICKEVVESIHLEWETFLC